MGLQDSISKVPSWGWLAGGGLAIGLVLLVTRKGGAVVGGGQTSDLTDVLASLTNAINTNKADAGSTPIGDQINSPTDDRISGSAISPGSFDGTTPGSSNHDEPPSVILPYEPDFPYNTPYGYVPISGYKYPFDVGYEGPDVHTQTIIIPGTTNQVSRA